MTAPSNTAATKLYTPEMLALAVSLADYPMRGELPFAGEARSRTCGSSIQMAVDAGVSGTISEIGMAVSACAVGQAAAAIFAAEARGHDMAALIQSHDHLERWLSGEGTPPDWPGIEALDTAHTHPGRHGAIMLPWKAALDALSKAPSPR